MKQLLILSGKGGSGKTTIASAFIKLSNAKCYADCDVDAPNLHLVTDKNMIPLKSDFYGLEKAFIDANLCNKCGLCKDNCNFNAIIFNENDYKVDNFSCEGCGLCETLCPQNAVALLPSVAGNLELFLGQDTAFSTAKLNMGSGTSGKLVTEVKRQMKNSANDAEFAIIDGSPGIGCPVIASISGVDLVLIVAEPSLSGISDMERIVKTAQQFNTEIIICVNKYDINEEKTEQIIDYCKKEGLIFVGKIPYDLEAVQAVNSQKSIVEIKCKSGEAVKNVYNAVKTVLFKENIL